MQTIFDTEWSGLENPFKAWRETICGRIAPVEQFHTESMPFQGRIEVCDVGSLAITRLTQSALHTKVTRESIRRDSKRDSLSVILKISGDARIEHNGISSIGGPGDIIVIDRSKVAILESNVKSSSYIVDLPRGNFERHLGRAALFSGLVVARSQLSAALTCSFLERLIQGFETASRFEAARVATILEDLLVAAVAERLCREPSTSTNGTLTLLRAKAYVRDHLGDRGLDPHSLASAVGISIRRLQELFHEHEQSASDWIWQCRCEAAAAMLRDMGSRHLTIGEVADKFGFATQAHLSRRFKDRFGQTPCQYRQQHHRA